MLTQNKLIYICTILFLLSSISFGNEELAIVTKSKGNVDYKKSSSSEFQKTVKSGLELYNDDLLKTGDNGFVMFVYLDDGSLIKVHKNSEVYITGKIQDKNINKRVNAGDGFFRFDVKEQKGDEFTVVTPSSVASVKGTSFWIDCNGENGDQFFGESGSVVIRNRESGEKKQLTKNKVANSLPDGSLKVREITPQELEMLEKREADVGESGNSNEGDAQSGSSAEDNQNEIIIELEDASGNKKTITVKVQ